MSFPKNRSSQKPQSIIIDKYEIKMYHDAGIARFHRRKIVLGVPTTNKEPTFTFRFYDFTNYFGALEQFIDILKAWLKHWKTG